MMRVLSCAWDKSLKQFMIYRATGWLTFFISNYFLCNRVYNRICIFFEQYVGKWLGSY